MTTHRAATYDLAIIGGGLVGLATAYRLLERKPGLRVAVVEKEPALATHQSGRNSGVVHSGLYYRPGSLKARLCREGKAALERFADEHGIPRERCGKLVVAVRPSELPRLAELGDRGRANGVEGLEEIGSEEIRELEPNATGIRALHCPGTGVVDYRRVAGALGEAIRAAGGEIHLDREVTAIRRRPSGPVLVTTAAELQTRGVITCAGLQSDRIAALNGHRGGHRIVPFRGDYYRLAPHARMLVRNLIYPVPDPSLPFLGVHFTRRISGDVWVGPNAIPALAREGYRRGAFRLEDTLDILSYPGFWRLAGRYLRTGMAEMSRDLIKAALVRQARRYVPGLRAQDLILGPSGVRAQAVGRDGTLIDDFVLEEGPGVIHVRNAPSPAATACLAIGSVLTELSLRRFDLG